tara:strand:+ start:56 stop:493 length:438 start_codon:yes stop_codon:yes gene_type:complete
MPLLIANPDQVARSKPGLGLTFEPCAKDADGEVPRGHTSFLSEARSVKYDTLVDTCLSDPSLKTCAAVLIERFCFDRGITRGTFLQLLRNLEGDPSPEIAALYNRCKGTGYVDLTTLPEAMLQRIVLDLPMWYDALLLQARLGKK